MGIEGNKNNRKESQRIKLLEKFALKRIIS